MSSRHSVVCVEKRLCKSRLGVCLSCSFNLQGIHCRDRLVLGPTFSGSDRNPPLSQRRNQVPARPRVICARQPCTGRRTASVTQRVDGSFSDLNPNPLPDGRLRSSAVGLSHPVRVCWLALGQWAPLRTRDSPLPSSRVRGALDSGSSTAPGTRSPEHRVLLVPHLLTPLGTRPRRPLHPGGWSQSLFHSSFKRKTRRMLPFYLLNDLIPKGLGHHGISMACFPGHF